MFNLVSSFLDLIFPIFCLDCHREGSWLCHGCSEKLKQQINSQQPHYYPEVVEDFDKFFVVSQYHQAVLPDILHVFKYQYVIAAGQCLSDLAVDYLKTQGDLAIDVVVPVPLSKKRELLRGFNQATVIAQAICHEFGLSLNSGSLIRKFNNRPQVGLNAEQRWENVKNIFSVTDDTAFKDKKILLIDDVITTGATLRQCAKILKKSGAKEVWGLVLFKS